MSCVDTTCCIDSKALIFHNLMEKDNYLPRMLAEVSARLGRRDFGVELICQALADMSLRPSGPKPSQIPHPVLHKPKIPTLLKGPRFLLWTRFCSQSLAFASSASSSEKSRERLRATAWPGATSESAWGGIHKSPKKGCPHPRLPYDKNTSGSRQEFI